MPSPFVIRGDQLKQKKKLKPLSFWKKLAGIKLQMKNFIKIVQLKAYCSVIIIVIHLTDQLLLVAKLISFIGRVY
jgi:hypothetical protein